MKKIEAISTKRTKNDQSEGQTGGQLKMDKIYSKIVQKFD